MIMLARLLYFARLYLKLALTIWCVRSNTFFMFQYIYIEFGKQMSVIIYAMTMRVYVIFLIEMLIYFTVS